MYLVGFAILLIVAVIYAPKLLGKGKSKEDPVPYVCTRCEMMYYAPNIPLNSRCPACGGGVQPY